MARALTALPLASAAMAKGELSFSQVRALSRVATPDDEEDLLELARGCSTAQLERMIRAWKRGKRKDDAAAERARHASRSLSIFPDEEGMYLIRGQLDPEVGALLMRAIEGAGAALFRKRTADGSAEAAPETAPRRRRAIAKPPSGGRTRSACTRSEPFPPASGRRGATRSAAPGQSATRC